MKPSTSSNAVTVTATTISSSPRPASRAVVYENRHRFNDWGELGYYPELVPDRDEDTAGIVGPGVDLDALMRRYRRKLVRAAHCRLGSRRLAEDLLQDLCLEALSGQLVLPIDAESAAEALLEEIVERCKANDENP